MASNLWLSLDAARNHSDLRVWGVYFHVAQFGKCSAFFLAFLLPDLALFDHWDLATLIVTRYSVR